MRTALGWTALLIATLIPALTGCGSGKFFIPVCQAQNNCGGGNGTYSSYAYVANTSGTIALFPIPTASFTNINGTTLNLGSQLSALAATPTGTLLYVATTAGSVFVYAIGTNGALTTGNSGSPVASTLNPVWMTVDPSGNWLFLISSNISTLLEYQINTSTGVLSQVGSGISLSSGTPTQVYVTPNNQNVYVGLSGGGVDAFSFNSSNGALSNHLHLNPRAGGDNAITADPNSKYLFVGEAGSGIRVFTIGSGGSLTEVSGSPFASPLGPNSIVVDPTSSYVYVANRTANVITGYSLNSSNGALTQLSSSPFSSGSLPTALSLDSTGKYLLVISNGGGPDLQIFSFDSTTPGKLDSVATSNTGNDPTNPVSLAVVP